MRDTTGQVTSRTVGYKRISSILPMQPNRFCIWSLVACGAMFVTWTTLVDMFDAKSMNFSHTHSHSLKLFHYRFAGSRKHSFQNIRNMHTMRSNDERDASNDSALRSHTFDSIRFDISNGFYLFQHSIFRWCFKYVYHTRQCTPFLKQEKEVSVGANEWYNLTNDHIDCSCCQMPSLTSKDSSELDDCDKWNWRI